MPEQTAAMGVSWGLRHSADGKGPGVECVILGGAHGDIPIEPTGGAIVADLVVDENVNTIIDFSRKANGQMWTLGEKVRFVTDYTLRLFQRQGELVNGRRREPLMQILDEAARYIPQVIPSGAVDLARCVGAWEQVCEEGRNIGLGVGFITQRSARMNKSVSELADVMFAFRTVGPNSLGAVMDWLGEHVEKGKVKDLAEKVHSLDIGQALVVSPGWLKVEKIAQIRARETFDSSATPKPGQQSKRVTGKAAKPDLAAYEARMVDSITKAKADDPKTLRAEIASLKKQLAVAASPLKGSAKVAVDERAIEHAVTRAVAAQRTAAAHRFSAIQKPAAAALERAKTLVTYCEGILEAAKVGLSDQTPIVRVAETMPSTMRTSSTEPSARVSQGEPVLSARQAGASLGVVPVDGITVPQQRILNALAGFESMGIKQDPIERADLAEKSQQSPTSSGYANNLGRLRSLGLIGYRPGQLVHVTDLLYPEGLS